MLTDFGRLLRQHRIERSVTLGEIGKATGVTASFVSAVETGKKTAPTEFINKAGKSMQLAACEIEELQRAAYRGFTEVRLPLKGRSDREKELVMAFARRFESMSEQEVAKIFKNQK